MITTADWPGVLRAENSRDARRDLEIAYVRNCQHGSDNTWYFILAVKLVRTLPGRFILDPKGLHVLRASKSEDGDISFRIWTHVERVKIEPRISRAL